MNSLTKRFLTAALGALLAATGCASKVVDIQVKVVGNQVRNSPLDNVTHMRVRVVGDDGTKISESIGSKDTGTAKIEQIPNGRPVRIEVTGFNGDPNGGGAIVSFGSSGLFTVPDTVDENAGPVNVSVFLRAVDKFSPVVSIDDPATAVSLSVPRAGHTATLLDDGRVLIAGGFEAKTNVPTDWTFRESVEIFDPATGKISTDSPPMQFNGRPTARGFHTATKLQNGQVLIAGGEVNFTTNGRKSMATLASAVLFDPTVDSNVGGWASATMNFRRSRHTATLHGSNKVLMVGGIDWNGTTPNVQDAYEWFEPDQNLFKKPTNPISFKRVGHAAVGVLNNNYVAIVGGNNGTKNYDTDGVRFFQLQNNEFVAATQGLELRPARSFASVTPIGEAGLLAIGGFQSTDLFKPTNSYAGSDWVRIKPQLSRADGPAADLPVGHVCSVTLRDGRVLAIGGRGKAGADDTQVSLAGTTVYAQNGDQVVSTKGDTMNEPRYFHTCTVLADGAVLVTGGIAEQGGTFGTLSSMEIYTPPPAE